jgi:putative ABC transport system ATP-binding protein
MEVIKAEDLVKTYSDNGIEVHAVQHIDLSVQEGEFTAIVGPSGCGKTTLLNILGGIDQPTSGKVFIDGAEITKLSDRKLIDFRLNNIGYVFQAYNLIPVLTAYENTEFIMLLQKWPKEKREARAIELLEKVGLKDKMKNRPGKLSGGQQQRVAVARALASKPKFVLADEPTANLDSAATTQLLDIMYQLNQEENITFVFATHDQRVMDRAKRIIKLDDGKIIEDIRVD